jgi:hypothetical protein
MASGPAVVFALVCRCSAFHFSRFVTHPRCGDVCRGDVATVQGSGRYVSWDRTEPQLGARVALQIYNRWRDGWVIDLIFDALLSWNTWVWTARRGEGVLAGSDGHADLIVLGSDPH